MPRRRTTSIDGRFAALSRVIARVFGRETQRRPTGSHGHPFGTVPKADRGTYLRLHREAVSVRYAAIDALERRLGYALDREWMNELALHTQAVVKDSRLNYGHGRILYACLRRYLASHNQGGPFVIFETGTARGFSALCMAQALCDARVFGHLVTVDVLPHETSMLWNCIDDHDGPRTRRELLARYADLMLRIVFVQGRSDEAITRLGLSRIHFAFLDAAHTADAVLSEFDFVSARQQPGDMIIFDDVTPALFAGVVEAVDEIEAKGNYVVERIAACEERGYAIATRTGLTRIR